jgi:hypothetical protein
MCSEVEVGKFKLVYGVLFNADKSVLKMNEILWKNSPLTAKSKHI